MPPGKVSLYIPCYNAAQTIRQGLVAVLKQTYPIEEIIVIDDGSTDNTVEIVSKFPIKLFRHKNNKGLASSRNTAIKKINTEFIASLDSDCVPDPDWLLRLMRNFASLKIAGAGGRLLESRSSTVFDLWRSAHMKQCWGNRKRKPAFLFGSNTVFRKDALLDVGLYNEKLKSNYEDVDLSERLKKKGWNLVYEPKAAVYHLRKDDIYSLLDTYWRWNICYYQRKGFYSSPRKFVLKLKDNIGLANRYIEEDLDLKLDKLLYLDFLLGLHHSLKDLDYFITKNRRNSVDYPHLSLWLSLIDLTLFFHIDCDKNKVSTLIPKKDALLQNFFALNLVLGKSISGIFTSKDFKRILYKHLLLSIYKIDDGFLSESIFNLADLHKDWDCLIKKRQPNIDILFLKNFFLHFQKWLKHLAQRFPDVVNSIETSAKKTDSMTS